jgi:hypothetical protein
VSPQIILISTWSHHVWPPAGQPAPAERRAPRSHHPLRPAATARPWSSESCALRPPAFVDFERSSVGIGKRMQKKSCPVEATCFSRRSGAKSGGKTLIRKLGAFALAVYIHPMLKRPNFDKPQEELSQGIAKLHVALAVFSQCLQLRPEGHETCYHRRSSPLPLHTEIRVHTIANGIVPPFRTGAPNSPGLAVGREFKGRIQRRLQPFQPMDRQGSRQQRGRPATRQGEGNGQFLSTGDDVVMLLAWPGSPDKVASDLRGNGRSAF